MKVKEDTITNGKLFSCIKELTNAFMTLLDSTFIPEYGSSYDRIKVLLSAEPDLL